MLHISRKMLMIKAKKIYDEKNDDPATQDAFIASRGWCENLSLRRKTTTAQKDPSYLIDRLVAYILHLRRLQRQHNFECRDIVAMDETPVWNDMVSNTTVEFTGAKDVPMKSTGHEKVRVTVCLTAKGDGTKLKPFISLEPLKEKQSLFTKNSRKSARLPPR